MSILGAFLLLLVAWQYRLDAYQLVYSTRGAATGASYTDVHAQLPAYNLLSLVTAATAILIVVTAYLRSRLWRAVVVLLVIWFGISILAGNVYPGLIQRFQVSPNELNLERPYIANNIEFTRRAFDLHTVEPVDYDTSRQFANALRAEPQTIRNIRLWDYRPLLQTYNQIQALRHITPLTMLMSTAIRSMANYNR